MRYYIVRQKLNVELTEADNMTIILSDGYTDLEQNIVDNTDPRFDCLCVIVNGKWMVDNVTDIWAERIAPTKEALDALVNELSEKDEFELYSVSIGDMFDYDDYINRDA
jgi:hypothetical protein